MSTRTVLNLLACGVAVAAAAGVAPVQASGTWDADGDQVLTRQEFCTGAFELWRAQGALDTRDRQEWLGYCARTTLFDAWDRNADGRLDRDEFAASVFEQWESTGDALVSPAEWARGVAAWFGPGASLAVTLDDWDLDGDGYLTSSEFNGGFDWRIF